MRALRAPRFADSTRLRSDSLATLNSSGSSPLAAWAIALPTNTPTGMISMPAARRPRPAAISGVVPIPEKGSKTDCGSTSSDQLLY